jgi:hypothetical protein
MSKARDIASAAPAPSTVSATEIGYLDGVTSAIQTQLDAKTAKSTLTTTGDIYYASAANTPARLGIGSTDQVLKVTAGVPAWATPSAGGMTLIQETVASANSSISFSSIPSTYKSLLLVWTGIKHTILGSNFDVRLNNSSSTIYGGTFWGTGTTGSTFTTDVADGKTRIGGDSWGLFGQEVPNGVSLLGSSQGQLYIDNYASTTKFKPYRTIFSHYNDAASAYRGTEIWGNFASTSAVTSVDIVRLYGSSTMTNLSDTSIRLYGLS